VTGAPPTWTSQDKFRRDTALNHPNHETSLLHCKISIPGSQLASKGEWHQRKDIDSDCSSWPTLIRPVAGYPIEQPGSCLLFLCDSSWLGCLSLSPQEDLLGNRRGRIRLPAPPGMDGPRRSRASISRPSPSGDRGRKAFIYATEYVHLLLTDVWLIAAHI